MHLKTRQTCRICGSTNLASVLDLGPQFLSTLTVTESNVKDIPKRKVPLHLVRCNPVFDEQACGLVQLAHSYPSELMFSQYWYRSGVNQTMQDALADVVSSVSQRVDLGSGDIVVDIGCNDGTLLNSYRLKGLDEIGFDPARNIVSQNQESFIRIMEFFSAKEYFKIRKKRAKVITSIAMFYDLENPNSFVKDVSAALDPQGIWVVQFADLLTMLQKNMFDNMIHEHIEYYHLAPVEYMLHRHDLKLLDIEKNEVNGGSYRLYIGKTEGKSPSTDAYSRIMAVRREEFEMSLDSDEPYNLFRRNSEDIREKIISFVNEVQKKGQLIIGYGASTKGNTLLQYCGLSEKEIPFIADRNPRKWGGWTMGTKIPIISEEEARKMRPDYFFVLPYYFIDEIIRREKDFLEMGGRFLIPIPNVQVVGS